jgi:hypothetical protein
MSALPDIYVEPRNETFLLVANQKARRFLNKGFKKPRPQWSTVGGGCFASPEYRAIELQGDCRGGLAAMLCVAYDAGLNAMFKCANCDQLHPVDDEQANLFRVVALEGSAGALPAHRSLQ